MLSGEGTCIFGVSTLIADLNITCRSYEKYNFLLLLYHNTVKNYYISLQHYSDGGVNKRYCLYPNTSRDLKEGLYITFENTDAIIN